MEKRVTTLEAFAEQLGKAIERLERSVNDLRANVDRKFMWMIGIQIATLLTVIGILFARPFTAMPALLAWQ